MLVFFFVFVFCFFLQIFLQKLIVKILKIVTLTPGTKLGPYEGFKV